MQIPEHGSLLQAVLKGSSGSAASSPHRRPRRPGQRRGPPGGDSASRPAMAVSFEIGRFPGASAPHTSPSPRPAPSCARPTRLSQPHARRRACRRAASRRARRPMTHLARLPRPAPSPHDPSASPVLSPVYPSVAGQRAVWARPRRRSMGLRGRGGARAGRRGWADRAARAGRVCAFLARLSCRCALYPLCVTFDTRVPSPDLDGRRRVLVRSARL